MPSRPAPARPRLTALPLEDRTTPAVAYALSGTSVLALDTASPTLTQVIPVANVNAGETLVGIDFRPQNGLLYGFGVNASANTGTLYTISVRTGVAGVVGTAGQISFQDGTGATIDLPDPATVGYGFDFNPAADRVRVVAGALNFRVNPNTGASVDGDLGGAAGSVANTNPDGAINGSTTTVDATAYTNSQPNNGGVTTQYTLDAAGNQLFIQNPPNSGTQTNPGGSPVTITLAGNPLDFAATSGFDIPAGVNAPSSNAAVTTGSAFAVLNVGGTTGLYAINLVNGQATFVGNVGNGSAAVQGFTVQSDLGGLPAVSLNAAGDTLLRFNTATPGTTTTQALNLAGVVSGETLAGIDFRPQTGQLYGLGVDATANTGTLYLIDPQNGAVSIAVAGTASAITFAGTDFPDPATAGYGFDFNPTVDRIRVTTGSGLNFRINPNTGLPAAATVDGAITGLPGGSTGVSATAYTNAFGQSLTGGVTTQYTLDAASNSLFIQNPPNNGTQTGQLAITLGGAALDFTVVSGFDIPAGVRVTTSNTAAAGFGYAVLTVGGVTGLYRIDLTTGVATNPGAVGAGATALAGLALADAPTGTVSFLAATDSVHEENGPLAVTLTRTSTNGSASVTVTPVIGTADGTDLTLAPVVATFGDGAATATVFIPITNDPDDEPDETFTLTLSNPTNGLVVGAPAVSAITILDDDLPPGTVMFDAATYSVNEAAGTLAVTLTRPPGSAGGTVIIELTAVTAGAEDLTLTPVTVNFANGQTTATVNIPITNDGLDEPDETFRLRLIFNTGGVLIGSPDQAVATIVDDDPTPTAPPVLVPAPPAPPTPPTRPAFFAGTGSGLTTANAGGTQSNATPFAGFGGEVRVAAGDVNGDGVVDSVVAAGPGGGSHVKVFDGATGAEIRSFFAYEGFLGGVYVASGDVNGDGFDDLLTGAGPGGGSHVKVFSGRDGALLRSFFAYEGFGNGVRVGAGDVNGDGTDDIVTVAGPGGNGHVKVFSGADGSLLRSFLAYANFAGEVFVAAGDLDGDGRAEVVTGSGAGTQGHVKVFSGVDNSERASFFAYPGFTGGARVAVGDVDGDGANEIITGAGPGGNGHVKAFDGRTFALKLSVLAGPPSALGGVFVA